MAVRTRQLRVNALNFAIVDPSSHNKAEKYIQLMKALYGLERVISLRGNRSMTIGSMLADDRDPAILRGVLYGFINIDHMAWFNLLQNRPASEEELGQIVVPDGIAANYRAFDYEFHSESHTLVFVAHEGKANVSALSVRYVFAQLCKEPKIVEQFGDVNVSVAQEPEALDHILDAEDLRAITIVVRRPNAGLGGFEPDFEKELENLGASEAQVDYKAATKERLLPDKALRTAAKVALRNGVVDATVRRDGITEHISTEQFPVGETVKYNPQKESRFMAIRRAAEKIIARLKKLTTNNATTEDNA